MFNISGNYLSLYIAVIIIILSRYVRVQTRFTKKNGFVLILLVGLFMSLVHLSNRTSFLSIILISLFLLVFDRRGKLWEKSFILLSIIVVSIFIVKNVTHLNTKLTKDIFKNPDIELVGENNPRNIPRISRWIALIDNPSEIGFFGVGISNAQSYINKKYLAYDLKVAYKNGYNAHNQYLQTYIESGLLGLCLLLIILFYPFIYFCKHKYFYSASTVLIFIIFGMTESFLLRQSGVVFFVPYITLLLTYPVDKIFHKRND